MEFRRAARARALTPVLAGTVVVPAIVGAMEEDAVEEERGGAASRWVAPPQAGSAAEAPFADEDVARTATLAAKICSVSGWNRHRRLARGRPEQP